MVAHPTAVGAPAPEPPRSGAARPLPTLDFTSILPERSAQDILAGQVRLTLGREQYMLGVLSIAANRRWKAALEDRLSHLLSTLETAGEDLGGILSAFATATDQLLDALYAYDQAVDERGAPTQAGVLPPRLELEEVATDAEALMATLEVWSAANPFAGVALSAMRAAEQVELPTSAAPTNGSSTRTNSARPSTAGRRASSKRH